LEIHPNSTYADAGYPGRQLSPRGKFVENSTKLIYHEITGYRIKYSTVLWLLELEIRRGRKVSTQVRIVNSNSRKVFRALQGNPRNLVNGESWPSSSE